MKRIVILGGGTHGEATIDLIHHIRHSRKRQLVLDAWEIWGILDDDIQPGTRVMDCEVLGPTSTLQEARNVCQCAAIGVGGPHLRANFMGRIQEIGFEMPALIHPRAEVALSAWFGPGCHIEMGACVGAGAKVGAGALVNSNCVVSHHCEIGECAHIAPGAILAGSVKVGSRATVGIGATVYKGLSIGAGAMVCNGATVLSNVPDYGQARAGSVWTG